MHRRGVKRRWGSFAGEFRPAPPERCTFPTTAACAKEKLRVKVSRQLVADNYVGIPEEELT